MTEEKKEPLEKTVKNILEAAGQRFSSTEGFRNGLLISKGEYLLASEPSWKPQKIQEIKNKFCIGWLSYDEILFWTPEKNTVDDSSVLTVYSLHTGKTKHHRFAQGVHMLTSVLVPQTREILFNRASIGEDNEHFENYFYTYSFDKKHLKKTKQAIFINPLTQFSPSSKRLATPKLDKNNFDMVIYDREKEKVIKNPLLEECEKTDENSFSYTAFLSEDRLLHYNNNVARLQDEMQIAPHAGGRERITEIKDVQGITLSPDRTHLVIVQDFTIHIYTLPSFKPLKGYTPQPIIFSTPQNHFTLDFSPDNRYLTYINQRNDPAPDGGFNIHNENIILDIKNQEQNHSIQSGLFQAFWRPLPK